MTEHIVLVEPNYYTQYPPLGLLKLSTYFKQLGCTTELVQKDRYPITEPDKIYVTSLFTWSWNSVWKTVRTFKSRFPNTEIWLGGLYASLMPEHAKLSGADHIHIGLFTEAEDLMPDYSLVPKWNASIIFASRGCNNKCLNCVVPRLEGKICAEKKSIKKYIWPTHKKIIFFDNNILAMKYWHEIFEELVEINITIDFNQGLDARLLSYEAAELISKMKMPLIRLAYDNVGQKECIKNAIDTFDKLGISKRNIFVYSMFNFQETPDEFFIRVRETLNWGAVCYPMRFQPTNVLKKDAYISSNWTKKKLNMIAAARRVIGYGGAFPPYKGLVNKFNSATNFEEAFKLYSINNKEK